MEPAGPALPPILRSRRLVPAILAAVVVLALVNWILRPEEAMRWLRSMLILPGLWMGLALWRRSTLRARRRRGLEDDPGIARYFDSATALVFLAIGLRQIVAFGLTLWVRTTDHGESLDLERRILGLATSAVFVIIGNALPKILTPLSMLGREQAELVTGARRFVGATFLVLGLVMAMAFLSAPLELAGALVLLATGAILLTVLGAIVWMNVSDARRNG